MSYTKQLLILGGALLGGYIAIVLIVYETQQALLYFPTHDNPPNQLTPWIVRKEVFGHAREIAEPHRVWLMMPGNGGQAAHRDYILKCVGGNDAVFVLEYPGYGLRPGKPSRRSIDAAAIAAYRELRARFPQREIGVIGESLGSGPACVLAKETAPPNRIVLITPFDTLANVASEHYRFLPVRLLLRDRWDNIAALRDYKNPIAIYGAERDGIIPIAHARALAQATGASFTALPCGHNDWMSTGRVKLGRE